jgi:hypothetical protein
VLPDGRTLVEVTVFDPFLVTVVLVATNKRQALEQVRALGGRNVHVEKSHRRNHQAMHELVEHHHAGVFAPSPLDGTWLPVSELPAFLDGTSRALARYDVAAFNRRCVRPADDVS